MYKFKEDLQNQGEIAEQGEQWRPRNVALDLPWTWMLSIFLQFLFMVGRIQLEELHPFYRVGNGIPRDLNVTNPVFITTVPCPIINV